MRPALQNFPILYIISRKTYERRVVRYFFGLNEPFACASVTELVDVWDLKSQGSNTVPVRFRPEAPSGGTNHSGHMR